LSEEEKTAGRSGAAHIVGKYKLDVSLRRRRGHSVIC